jgi:hypothetical protein
MDSLVKSIVIQWHWHVVPTVKDTLQLHDSKTSYFGIGKGVDEPCSSVCALKSNGTDPRVEPHAPGWAQGNLVKPGCHHKYTPYFKPLCCRQKSAEEECATGT